MRADEVTLNGDALRGVPDAKRRLRDGVAAARAGDKPRALHLLREATALHPSDERAWLWRASVAPGFAEAHECVTRVLALKPDHPQALAALEALRRRAAEAGQAPAAAQPAPAPESSAPAGRQDLPSADSGAPSAPSTLADAVAGDRALDSPAAAPLVAAAARVEPAAAPLRPQPNRHDLRRGVPGFSPAATVFRSEPVEASPEQARPGSVLHLFDEPVEPGPAGAASDARPRPRPAVPNPIGFRPPFTSAPPQAARHRAGASSLAPGPSDREEAEQPAPTRGVVLVVDDSPTVTNFVEFELKQRRFDVLTAASGPEALQRLLSLTPDVVLVDADMPLMDGYQVCRAIRGEDRTRQVPVVIMSSGGGLSERVRCRLAGAAGYLVKPLDTSELVEALERHLPVRF